MPVRFYNFALNNILKYLINVLGGLLPGAPITIEFFSVLIE